MFKNLIPKIFYDNLQDGLSFFVDGLGFEVLYQDADMAVIARDGAKAYIVQSPEYAAKDRPELGIDTDDVDEIFKEMSARSPHLLHPNSRTGSTPILRTLQRSLIMGKRSVYVKAKKIQPRVQTGCC